MKRVQVKKCVVSANTSGTTMPTVKSLVATLDIINPTQSSNVYSPYSADIVCFDNTWNYVAQHPTMHNVKNNATIATIRAELLDPSTNSTFGSSISGGVNILMELECTYN